MGTAYKIQLSNIKKHNELSLELESSNVYMLKGSPETGKDSVLQAILSMFKVQNDNPNIISFGAKDAAIQIDITKDQPVTMGDGEKYILSMHKTVGNEERFSLVLPDGSLRKKKTDIRQLLQYNAYTVEQIWELAKTEKGRRELTEMIMTFIPKEVKNRISEIDKQINTKSGTLYVTRSGKNELFTGFKKVYEATSDISIDEAKLINKAAENKKRYDSIKTDLDALELVKTGQSDIIQQKADLQTSFNTLTNEITTRQTAYDDGIKTLHSEIADLQKLILAKEKAILDRTKTFESYKIELSKTLTETKTKIDNLKYDFDQAKYDSLKEQKDKADIFFKAVEVAQTKKENYELAEKRMNDAKAEWENFNTQIEDLRKEKQSLFDSAKLPMSNVVVEDGELYLMDEEGNRLNFDENQMSYSQTGIRVAKLLLELNKNLPFICLGHGESYGNKVHELVALAKEYQAVILCSKVTENNEELSIEVIQSK